MLLLSFILFIGSFAFLIWMVVRVFPELSHVTVIRHKQFSFLGIEDVHIIEYKLHKHVLKKDFFIFLEKMLRRFRSIVLKLDNLLSSGIEDVQQKAQSIDSPVAPRPNPADLSKIKNLPLLHNEEKQESDL